MPIENINYTDNLRQGTDKLNAAIDQSNEAIDKATTAEANSTNAVNTANNVQTQLNQVVIEGDSSVEAAQARVDSGGNTYTTLKERLDTKEDSFAAQLADTASSQGRPSGYSVWAEFEGRAINVKWFGAKGDGVSDDRQAFLDALEALKSIGGGILYIPPSQNMYMVSNHIEWDETYGHITILGSGRSSHVHLYQKSINGHLFGAIGSDNDETNWIPSVTFKDIQASTYNGLSNEDDNPIGVAKAKNVLFDNVYISFSNWKGITVQGHSKNITFKNCEVEKCKKVGYSVEFSTVRDIKVINCTSHNNGEQGALFTAAGDGGLIKGLNIQGLTSYENTLEGVSFSGCESPVGIGLEAYNNSAEGIKLYNTSRAKIQGKCYENTKAGYRSIGGSANIVSLVSLRNSLYDTDNRGNFFIESTPYTKLINCIGNEGVRSYTNFSENVDFENCLFEGTTYAGLSSTLAKETEGKTINHLGNRVTYGDSAPVMGTYKRGDIRQITNVTSGGNEGWKCVSSGKAHKTSTGTITNGSNQITGVTNIDTWSIGDRIQGGDIPFGTTVTNISGTTLTISNAATSSGVRNLYDAIFKSFGNISV